MSRRHAIVAACAGLTLVAAVVVILVITGGSGGGSEPYVVPGRPSVKVVSPRNGSRQSNHAVVVKVEVSNFRLAPRHFNMDPELGEGHIRFSLNRVPNCVDPVKLERALNSPLGKGRLEGRSLDFPRFSGPNGVLAERIGTAGSYSPATRPEIYYRNLPPGFYRLVINLAQNDGATTSAHAVTNFEIQVRPGHPPPPPCPKGKVSSAGAAPVFR